MTTYNYVTAVCYGKTMLYGLSSKRRIGTRINYIFFCVAIEPSAIRLMAIQSILVCICLFDILIYFMDVRSLDILYCFSELQFKATTAVRSIRCIPLYGC